MQYQKLYAEGAGCFRAADYVCAADKFNLAYEALPRTDALFMLASAHERLGHLRVAHTLYRRYLKSSPKDRAEVERRVMAIEQNLECTPTDKLYGNCANGKPVYPPE